MGPASPALLEATAFQLCGREQGGLPAGISDTGVKSAQLDGRAQLPWRAEPLSLLENGMSLAGWEGMEEGDLHQWHSPWDPAQNCVYVTLFEMVPPSALEHRLEEA